MHRRDFIKTCTAVAAASLASPPFFLNSLQAREVDFKAYKKALLLVNPEDLRADKQYIFFYPYRATPCLLMDIGKEVPPTEIKLSDGSTYRWPGGVGPKKSIVAYCAICPHQLSYPTPDFSFINYYPSKGRIVRCCAHVSVFDPKKGGTVLEGPANYPLTAIVLSYEGGKLYAVGTLGKELYEDFFDVFKPNLRKLYKSTRRAKKLVEECEVVEVEKYAKEVIRC